MNSHIIPYDFSEKNDETTPLFEQYQDSYLESLPIVSIIDTLVTLANHRLYDNFITMIDDLINYNVYAGFFSLNKKVKKVSDGVYIVKNSYFTDILCGIHVDCYVSKIELVVGNADEKITQEIDMTKYYEFDKKYFKLDNNKLTLVAQYYTRSSFIIYTKKNQTVPQIKLLGCYVYNSRLRSILSLSSYDIPFGIDKYIRYDGGIAIDIFKDTPKDTKEYKQLMEDSRKEMNRRKNC